VEEMVGRCLNVSAEMRPDAVKVLRDIPRARKTEQGEWEIPRSALQRVDSPDTGLGGNRFPARMSGHPGFVIVETHRILHDTGHVDTDVRDLVKILNSLHEIPNCLVPLCLGYQRSENTYSLVFEMPAPFAPEGRQLETLENILSNPAHRMYSILSHPMGRVQLAASLAYTLQAIHEAGFGHRAIGAHNILVHPACTPYLLGFDIATFQPLYAHAKQVSPGQEWRHRLYQHPECYCETNYTFRKEYDYYALGVVMLEMGRMQSFAQVTGRMKAAVQKMSPEGLQWLRVARAKELRITVGEEYSAVTVRLLGCDFGMDEGEVGRVFKEEVVDVLEDLVVKELEIPFISV